MGQGICIYIYMYVSLNYGVLEALGVAARCSRQGIEQAKAAGSKAFARGAGQPSSRTQGFGGCQQDDMTLNRGTVGGLGSHGSLYRSPKENIRTPDPVF